MRNILFVSTYPFPLDKGAFQHAYLYLKTLAAYFNVYGIFFLPVNAPEPSRDEADHLMHELRVKAYEFCRYRDDIHRNRFIYAMQQLAAFPYLHMQMATHPEGSKRINDYIQRFSIDLVHFELFHYTRYAFHTPRHVKKVVVYHDLYHRIDFHHVRYEKSYLNKFILLPTTALKKYIFERMLEERVDLKIFLNTTEMAHLPNKSVHVPHVVNPEIMYKEPRNKSPINILFLGGYNHPPNRVSFQFLIEEMLPRLVKTTRHFTLSVVGNGTEKFTPSILRSNMNGFVRIKGFVPDINDVFGEADIAFFPIVYGGGIKTKVIEAMAAGVPVVTTPPGVYGLEGLPRNALGVGRTPEELMVELTALMKDHSLRVERSRNAKQYIDSYHSLEQLSARLLPLYAGL